MFRPFVGEVIAAKLKESDANGLRCMTHILLVHFNHVTFALWYVTLCFPQCLFFLLKSLQQILSKHVIVRLAKLLHDAYFPSLSVAVCYYFFWHEGFWMRQLDELPTFTCCQEDSIFDHVGPSLYLLYPQIDCSNSTRVNRYAHLFFLCLELGRMFQECPI